MKVRKEWIGSGKPATQGNLAELQEDIHIDLAHMEDQMEKKFTTMEERLHGDMTSMEERLRNDLMSKETGDMILSIVKSTDERLRTLADIPERMTKVEDEVFKLKMRRS